MGTARQIALRLTPEDDDLLASLHARTGIQSTTDIIRMSLRALDTDLEQQGKARTEEPKKPSRTRK